MRELKIYAPTYFGETAGYKTGAKPEFGNPRVPVLIRAADGAMIVLGAHQYAVGKAPDIQIERRPNGWAIFLQPIAGGDSSGHLYFLDDGRSFLVPAQATVSTHPTKVLQWHEPVPDIDGPLVPKTEGQSGEDELAENCELCRRGLACSDENWDGLCPSCADAVSVYLDNNNLCDEDRDDVIRILRRKRNRRCTDA
jgi:hypothetical protein